MQNKHASHMLPPQLSWLCFQRFFPLLMTHLYTHTHTEPLPCSLTSTVHWLNLQPSIPGSEAQPHQEGSLIKAEPCGGCVLQDCVSGQTEAFCSVPACSSSGLHHSYQGCLRLPTYATFEAGNVFG